MLEIKINEAENSARIIVVGVGGAGNNAEGWNRDSLGDQSESGWCLSAEAG